MHFWHNYLQYNLFGEGVTGRDPSTVSHLPQRTESAALQ